MVRLMLLEAVRSIALTLEMARLMTFSYGDCSGGKVSLCTSDCARPAGVGADSSIIGDDRPVSILRFFLFLYRYIRIILCQPMGDFGHVLQTD